MHQEQPMPKDGKQVVMPALRDEFNTLADLRYKVGIERYGKPLSTFNGRDAGRDAVEEWFDLGIYLKQLRLEHQSLQAENVLLHKYCAFLRSMIQSGESNPQSFEEFINYCLEHKI